MVRVLKSTATHVVSAVQASWHRSAVLAELDCCTPLGEDTPDVTVYVPQPATHKH